MGLNMEPPDPGPRTRDPRLALSLLGLALGTLLIVRSLEDAPWLRGSQLPAPQHPPSGAGAASARLLGGCALLLAGAAGLARGPEARRRLKGAAAGVGGVLAFGALEASGWLADVRRNHQVALFFGVAAVAWWLLAPAGQQAAAEGVAAAAVVAEREPAPVQQPSAERKKDD